MCPGVRVSAHLCAKEPERAGGSAARSNKNSRLSAGFGVDFSAIFQLSTLQCEGV